MPFGEVSIYKQNPPVNNIPKKTARASRPPKQNITNLRKRGSILYKTQYN